MNKPRQICIHKSSWKDWDSRTDWKDIDEIRKYHIEERGFDDVAYHYFILKDGTLQTGRKHDVRPASCKGHNTDVLAICLQGEFMIEQPTSAQTDTLTTLLYTLCKTELIPNGIDRLYGKDKSYECTDMMHILCHDSYGDLKYPGNKYCPGKNLKRIIPLLAYEVNEMLKKGI